MRQRPKARARTLLRHQLKRRTLTDQLHWSVIKLHPAQQLVEVVQGEYPAGRHDACAWARGALIIRIIGPAKPSWRRMRRREALTLGSSLPFSSNPAPSNCLRAETTTSGGKSPSSAMASTARLPSHSAQMRLAEEFSDDAWCVSSTYRSVSPSISCVTTPWRRGRGMNARAVDMGRTANASLPRPVDPR